MRGFSYQLIFYQIVFFLIINYTLSKASSIEIKDTIETFTIWDVDTVKITGNLFLDRNDTLIIEPGTRVEFQGHFSFNYAGKILAIGNVTDTIVFTINDTTWFSSLNTYLGGWEKIEPVSLVSSEFIYCKFEYGKSFHPYRSPITGYLWTKFSHCLFQKMYCPTTAINVASIENCQVSNNFTSGIRAMEVNQCAISNNLGDGLIITRNPDYFSQGVYNSEINNNKGYGVSGENLRVTQINENIISKNGGAIHLESTTYKNTPIYINNNKITENKNYETIYISGYNIGFSSNLIADNKIDQNFNGSSFNSIISVLNGRTEFYNNTVVSNKSNFPTFLFIDNIFSCKVINNIFWNNENLDSLSQIIVIPSSSGSASDILIENCIIQNNIKSFLSDSIIITQKNNIYDDPLFIDTPNRDYRLADSSPCINHGVNLYSGYSPELSFPSSNDLSGNRRIIGQEDIGAYEYIYDSILIKKLDAEFDTLKICLTQYKELFIESVNDGYAIKWNWQKDGTELPKEHDPFIWLQHLKPSDEGTYKLTYSEYQNDPTYNQSIVVKFFQSDFITEQTGNINICQESDTVLIVKTLTNNHLTFRWFKNNQFIENDNDSIVLLKSVSEADTGNYYCIVDDGCSLDTSETIHVTIIPAPDTNKLFYISNIPEINKYKISINNDLKNNWQLFYGLPDNMTFKTILNSSNNADYIDQTSNPDIKPEYYIAQSINLCNNTISTKIIQKPLFVNFQLIKQDTLYLNIEKYEGLPSDTIYIFDGNVLSNLNIIDTLISENTLKKLTLTNLPYQETYYCAAIKVSNSEFSYSNVFLKPRHNSPPNNIILSENFVSENLPIGTIVGELKTFDNDPSDNHEYKIISGSGFYIDGDFLKSNQIFNYTIQKQFPLTIRSIDSGPGNMFMDKEFLIEIIDIGENSVIETNDKQEELSIFPNPFITSTTVKFKNPNSKILEIRLFNMFGDNVFTAVDIESNTYVFNRSDLNPGIYIAVIKSNSMTYHQSIVIN